jgi:hypothetical protein
MERFTTTNRLTEKATRKSYRRYQQQDGLKNSLLYSQTKGIYFSLILTFLLWWIPILGPGVAGYVSGRRSGDGTKGLISSMVTISAIILVTFALLPFKSGPLAFASTYFSQGVLTISSSKLIAASNLLTDMYTSYGIIKTFAVLVPGAMIELLTFSYVGGSVSYMKSHEVTMMQSLNRNSEINSFRNSRNTPTVTRATRGLSEYRGNEVDSEDDMGVPYSSI